MLPGDAVCWVWFEAKERWPLGQRQASFSWVGDQFPLRQIEQAGDRGHGRDWFTSVVDELAHDTKGLAFSPLEDARHDHLVTAAKFAEEPDVRLQIDRPNPRPQEPVGVESSGTKAFPKDVIGVLDIDRSVDVALRIQLIGADADRQGEGRSIFRPFFRPATGATAR